MLAARRAGLRKIVLPERNRKDLVDIPENVKDVMDFRFVSTMDQVLDIALKKKRKKNKNQISIVNKKNVTA